MAVTVNEYRYFFDDVQFGIDVREARRQLRVYQQQVADLAGLESGTVISRIERGQVDNSLTLTSFLKICEVLDLKPGYYFDLALLSVAHEYNGRSREENKRQSVS